MTPFAYANNTLLTSRKESVDFGMALKFICWVGNDDIPDVTVDNKKETEFQQV